MIALSLRYMSSYLKGKKDISPAEQTRLEDLLRFQGEESDYFGKLATAYHLLENPAEEYNGRYAGDMFKIAQSTEADPMFRVSALERIGHFNFNYTNKGDMFQARRVLKKLTQDNNLPATVKAAATAAHELTREKHMMVGGNA